MIGGDWRVVPGGTNLLSLLAGKALECRTQDRKFGGSIPPHDLWEFLQPKFDAECGLRYKYNESITKKPTINSISKALAQKPTQNIITSKYLK